MRVNAIQGQDAEVQFDFINSSRAAQQTDISDHRRQSL